MSLFNFVYVWKAHMAIVLNFLRITLPVHGVQTGTGTQYHVPPRFGFKKVFSAINLNTRNKNHSKKYLC